MGVSEDKIKHHFKIKPPQKSAFTIKTPDNMPKMHQLLIASGRRGGGKSVAVSNHIKNLYDNKIIDRIILITPTYHSNAEIWKPLPIAEEDILDPSKFVLKKVIKAIEGERKDWDDFKEIKRKYKVFKEMINSEDDIVTSMPPDVIEEFDRLNFFDQEPFWKYRLTEPPRVYVVIDDCMGTPLLACPSAGLTRFIIAHRHWGGGLGCSVAMLVQSYSGIGAIARPIRENCTLLLLFKCIQDVQLKRIFSEVIGDEMTEEEFLELFHHACAEQFGFLTIDFSAEDKQKMFRKCFDTYLALAGREFGSPAPKGEPLKPPSLRDGTLKK
tara:strand:- start:1227 stop:2204 length:978 start_codon:yes stop_codon:yes gene_type:complete